MKKNKIITFAAVLLISTSAMAAKHMVMVANFSFTPNNILNVTVGDTIQWMWSSGTHNTTSGVIPGGAAAWGAPINSAATLFEYKVTVAGNYGYTCTFHSSMIAGFVATAASGIGSASGALLFSFYPNPITEKSVLNIESVAAHTGRIVVTDLLGREISNQAVEFISGSNRFGLPLADKSSGIYFVSLLVDNKQVSVIRLVKE